MTPVAFSLQRAPMSPNPQAHAAHVRTSHVVRLEDLIREMKTRGTTVSESDLRAVLSDLIDLCKNHLFNGARIQIGDLVRIYPRIRGVFDGNTDRFDSSRHTLDVGASACMGVRREFRNNGQVSQQIPDILAPTLRGYRDILSATTDTLASSGSIGELNGKRLQFDPAQADEGIYFVAVDGSHTIQVEQIYRNTDRFQAFLNPPLQPTPYYVEVRKRFSPTAPLRINARSLTIMGA